MKTEAKGPLEQPVPCIRCGASPLYDSTNSSWECPNSVAHYNEDTRKRLHTERADALLAWNRANRKP